MTAAEWQPTTCVLFGENCGLEVLVEGRRKGHGIAEGDLVECAASDFCDPLTMTPYHKNVPVRIRKAHAAVD